MLTRSFTIAVAFIFATIGIRANNINVSSPALTGNDPFAGTVNVQFNISWANSWRGQSVNNWDAAWVFVKYRTTGNPAWTHMKLTETGHTAPAGSQIDLGLRTPGTAYNATTNPVLGVYVRRSVDGTGTFTATGVQLKWNYGALGINYIDIAQMEVFGIEMVYVPQGAFAAGSGGTETNAFTLTTINTAAANTAPTGFGSLGGQAGGYPTGQTAPTTATWPNGFNAYYCMKYEVTQQGFVDFLNTLTYDQQYSRTGIAPNSTAGTGGVELFNLARNGIDIQTSGAASTTPAVYACNLDGDAVYGEATDGKDLACNFLSWYNLIAYLDWSALRPMTELEFEKACRGIVPPVPNGYPWGSTTFANAAYTLVNVGANNEGIATNYSTTVGNASITETAAGITGPLRVGIFAANAGNTGRVTAGATYYGVMEMAGNLYERTISIGLADGRLYIGSHGDGALLANGAQNEAFWPGPTGCGFRGGSFSIQAAFCTISDRIYASVSDGSSTGSYGGRGVRTAP